ncbi:hypothetical protein ACFE04_016484 [Oxalis oulophora]
MATKFFIYIFLVLHHTVSHSLYTDNFLHAADILSYSGYLSMSLTLSIVYDQNITMLTKSQSLTIFAPSDSAFSKFGQLTISEIGLYFSPLNLSLEFLEFLPRKSMLPTLSPNEYLLITSSPKDNFVAINGVRIDGSPLLDDGSLVIFGIEEFFYPNFGVSRPLECVLPSESNVISSSVEEASEFLNSRGHSITASFLNSQVMEILDQNSFLTIFTVGDDMVRDFVGNFSEYSSLFLRHVVPCKMEWRDLVSFDDGTIIRTYLEGYKINVTKFGEIVMANNAPVVYPDMYSGDLMVIHGLNQVLMSPEDLQLVFG